MCPMRDILDVNMCVIFALVAVVSPNSVAFQPFLESSFQQVYEMRDVSGSGWLVDQISLSFYVP